MVVKFSKDPLYLLIRDEDIKAFNLARKEIQAIDFRDCDFRGLDLR